MLLELKPTFYVFENFVTYGNNKKRCDYTGLKVTIAVVNRQLTYFLAVSPVGGAIQAPSRAGGAHHCDPHTGELDLSFSGDPRFCPAFEAFISR